MDAKEKTQNGGKHDTEVEEEPDLRYGCCTGRPSVLQCLNTGKWWLLWMSLGNIFQSMTVNGLIGLSMSTLEKRFKFSSQQSSFIANAYDMSTIPVIIIVSYLGARAHRPVWVGTGLFILALGSVIFILPHFITPVYDPTSVEVSGNNLCRDRSNETMCKQDSVGSGTYLAIFIIGRLLHGIGATPLYTLGVTFMDDAVTKEQFSLYVGTFYAAGVLGPAIGFIGGGFLLNVFTDFPSVDVGRMGLTPDDPRWVGAWWLGFIIAAIPLFLLFLPMIGYRRDIPGAAEIRAKKKCEAYNADEDDMGSTEAAIKVGIKQVPKLLLGLVTNPSYVFLTLFGCCDSLLIGGFTAFGPKYVETQFSISAGFAGMLFGIITIPGGAGGTIVGGWIVKRFKLSCQGIMRTELIITVLLICLSFLFFLTCESVPIAGVTTPYVNSSEVSLIGSCNNMCNCTDVPFDPVCSVENIRFYSPCHAGCIGMEGRGTKNYFNCSCISTFPSPERMGSSTVCSSPNCRTLPVFMVLFFVVMFLIFNCSAMGISATVRCVTTSQRSIAIGIQWVMIRLLGTIPGPVLLGAAFDASCSVWENRCGKRGTCLSHNNRNLALYLFLVAVAIKIVSGIFITLAWRLYKPPKVELADETLDVDGKPAIPTGSDELKAVNGAPATISGNLSDNVVATPDASQITAL